MISNFSATQFHTSNLKSRSTQLVVPHRLGSQCHWPPTVQRFIEIAAMILHQSILKRSTEPTKFTWVYGRYTWSITIGYEAITSPGVLLVWPWLATGEVRFSMYLFKDCNHISLQTRMKLFIAGLSGRFWIHNNILRICEACWNERPWKHLATPLDPFPVVFHC